MNIFSEEKNISAKYGLLLRRHSRSVTIATAAIFAILNNSAVQGNCMRIESGRGIYDCENNAEDERSLCHHAGQRSD